MTCITYCNMWSNESSCEQWRLYVFVQIWFLNVFNSQQLNFIKSLHELKTHKNSNFLAELRSCKWWRLYFTHKSNMAVLQIHFKIFHFHNVEISNFVLFFFFKILWIIVWSINIWNSGLLQQANSTKVEKCLLFIHYLSITRIVGTLVSQHIFLHFLDGNRWWTIMAWWMGVVLRISTMKKH